MRDLCSNHFLLLLERYSKVEFVYDWRFEDHIKKVELRFNIHYKWMNDRWNSPFFVVLKRPIYYDSPVYRVKHSQGSYAVARASITQPAWILQYRFLHQTYTICTNRTCYEFRRRSAQTDSFLVNCISFFADQNVSEKLAIIWKRGYVIQFKLCNIIRGK